MKKDKTNLTGAHIREKRRALAQGRGKRRASAIAWYGLLAEVFFLPLSPSAATVALLDVYKRQRIISSMRRPSPS